MDNLKQIPFTDGYYCSKNGEIISFRENVKGSLLKFSPHKRDNVARVSLRVNGKNVSFKWSKVVALTYISNPDGHLHIRHKDGNLLNCSVQNLEWYTNSQIDKKGRFKKGRKSENEIWTKEILESKLAEFILDFYNKYGFILPSTQIKSYDSTLFSAFRKKIKDPNNYYLNLIKTLGLPTPSTSYYKDNQIFRGFYELVGYCFIKSWNIPFEPFKELNFGGKLYISDGFFTEINTYWEHWGGLNKNNEIKKEYYKIKKYLLVQTIDDECQKSKNGIKYLYDKLRESLLLYYPNIPEYNVEDRLKLISVDIPDYNEIVEYIIDVLEKNNQTNNINELILRETKDGYKVISLINKLFDGRVGLLKLELNKRGYNYNIKADRGSYKNIEYFVEQITPIIKKYKRVLTQTEFCKIGRNDIPIMAAKYFGGIEQLRRNELEEGSLFYITKSILKDSAPYDKKLEWGVKTKETVIKILQFFKKNNLELPNNLNDLRHNNVFHPFGKQLHTQINRKEIGGWENFKKQFGTTWILNPTP
jgi:hypothetical protein